MLRSIFFAACAALILHGPALAQPVPPTGKWVIDFDDDECVAMRSFGTEKDPLHLVIKPSPTSEVVQISLIRNGMNSDAVQEDATLQFDTDKPVKLNQLRYGAHGKLLRRINLEAQAAAGLAHATKLRWSAPGKDHELALGPMGPVMKVMAQCRDDLRRYWNIDPALQASLKQGPSTAKPLIHAFSSDDYPRQAVRNEEAGTTSIVLLIDETGQLADCMVDQSSNVATLDAMACFVIQDRVKFRSAIGSDGKPVRAVMTTRIRWVLP